MNCDHVRKVLDAHLDAELDDTTDRQVEQHLASCAGCAGLRDEREALRTGLRMLPRHAAPARLRSSIGAALTEAERRAAPRPARRLSWWQAAALAGMAAMLAFALGLWAGTNPSAEQDEREQAVVRHVASLGGGAPRVQVVSGDRHVVKPWFAGQLDFAPPVRELAEQGFVLVGARIDMLGGRTAAAIVYRLRKHDVTLFVTRPPDARSAAMQVSMLRGFALTSWAADGLAFTAVSDVDPKDLQRFSALVQAPAH